MPTLLHQFIDETLKLGLEFLRGIKQPIVVGVDGIESYAAHTAGIFEEREELGARDEETRIYIIIRIYVGRLPIDNLNIVIDGADLVGNILWISLYGPDIHPIASREKKFVSIAQEHHVAASAIIIDKSIHAEWYDEAEKRI